jgi:hypothetical protein
MLEEMFDMFEGGDDKRGKRRKNAGNFLSDDHEDQFDSQAGHPNGQHNKLDKDTYRNFDEQSHSGHFDMIKANPFVGKILKSKTLMATTAVIGIAIMALLAIFVVPLLGQALNKGGIKGILDSIMPLLNKLGD